nr:formyltransferase family protein [uncultured Desulfobacter sp.]
MTSILFVVGNDKISNLALSELEIDEKKIIVIRDSSTNIKRIWKLITNNRLSFKLILRMFFCELIRKRTKSKHIHNVIQIKNNSELLKLINSYKPEKVVLFRAGLIINMDIISTGVPILNVHCAKIPEFGGLGSIAKALYQRCYEQYATLHQVTKDIDTGTIFDVEPYRLNPKNSYCHNENVAYEAGIRLLQKNLCD